MKGVITSSILACWLWAIALAASPALHDWTHGEDAGHGEHACVATLLASGSCDSPDPGPPLVAMPAPVDAGVARIRGNDVEAVFLIGGPLERGPPAARA